MYTVVLFRKWKKNTWYRTTGRYHLRLYHYQTGFYILFMFMWPWIVTNFFLIKPTNALFFSKFIFVKKLYMFRAVPLPIIRSSPLYIRHWYMSCKFGDSFQARSGWNVLESYHQTCMTYTSAECTVENSWWWAEGLNETCRVSWQK
jgi:hypothetical protein